jgi:hypothetical protein
MDPDQTARMRRLVWIHAGRKRITFVLSLKLINVFETERKRKYMTFKNES